MLEQYGIKLYLHPEQNNLEVLQRSGAPRARAHAPDRLLHREHRPALRLLRARHVPHVQRARRASRTRSTGRCGTPRRWIKSNWKRLVGWHIKDANRATPRRRPPGNPFTQTTTRAGFPLNGGVDVIYSTRGPHRQGLSRPTPARRRPAREARPGPDRDRLPALLHGGPLLPRRGLQVPHRRDRHGPGGAADQGRSLRHAKISAKLLLGLK